MTLEDRALVPAERAFVPGPWRFAHGLQLPLDSLPWVRKADAMPYEH